MYSPVFPPVDRLNNQINIIPIPTYSMIRSATGHKPLTNINFLLHI